MTGTVSRHRHRTLLHDHDFRLLWVGETVSKVGSEATVFALPLIALTVLDADVRTVGILGAAGWLPWLLIALPAGAWVDQTSRRAVMQWCNAVSAVLLISIPFAAWAGRLTVAHLLVAAFGAGVAKVFFRTAYQAYLPVVVAKPRLGEGNAWMQGSAASAEVAGPGIAGVMAQVFGAVSAVFIDGLTFLVSALCIWRIRAVESDVSERRSNDGLLQRIGVGLRWVARDPYQRAITMFSAAGNLVLVAIQTLAVVFLIRTVDVSPGLAGILLASMGVGGVIGARLAGPIGRRFGTARGLLLAEGLTAPFGLLLPHAAPGWRLGLFAIGMVVVMGGVVVGGVICSAFRQAYTPPELLGRVSSVVSWLGFGALPIGAVLAGWSGEAWGIRDALTVWCALLLLPVLILALSPIRKLRDLPISPEGDLAMIPETTTWSCPIVGHRSGTTPTGHPLPDVGWDNGVAYCGYPGCGRSSDDPDRNSCECYSYECEGGCCGGQCSCATEAVQ